MKDVSVDTLNVSDFANIEDEHYFKKSIIYRKARPSDDAVLRQLLRDNPMDSWVCMSTEREPSYFRGEHLMGESMTVIAYEQNLPQEAVGMYSCAFLSTHINGSASMVGYLGGLRVSSPYRHKLHVLRNGFSSIQAFTSKEGKTPIFFTSLATENKEARRVLEANLKGMPQYSLVGEVATLSFSTKQGGKCGLLKQLQRKEVPALVEFFNRNAAEYQFSPVLKEKWLLGLNSELGLGLQDFWVLKNGHDICGCFAIWDQRKFKQFVSRGYRFPLNMLRRPYNVFAGATGRIRLPRPGQRLEQVFMPFMIFDESANDAIIAAVREGLSIIKNKGGEAGTLGVSVKNPLFKKLRDSLSGETYFSNIETVQWPDSIKCTPDGRPPQPEVALL